MLIPKNLAGKTFNIFHLHVDTATEMEYTIKGKYAVIETDSLYEFIFVGEKSVSPLWLALIIVTAIISVAEVGVIVYRKVRKDKAKENK